VTSQDLISKRIKELRHQRGLSQAELAHPELSDSYISLIESGSRTPTPAVLELLATKLGCSVSYLINGVTAEELEELELSLRYARMALENGETREARRRYSELLADPNVSRVAGFQQEVEYGLALSTEACGDLDEAIPILVRLRQKYADTLTDERRIASAVALSRCYRERGETAAAIEVAEQEISRTIKDGWTDHLIELGSTLLSSYYGRGDLLRARQYASELLSAAEALGTPRAIVAANWNAAIAADIAGQGDEALPLAERAWAVQSEIGEPRNLARLRMEYAHIRLRNRPDEAEECREQLLRAERELRESSASTIDLAGCLYILGKAEINLGNIEQAVEYALKSIELNKEISPELRAETQVLLGQAYLMLGRLDEAATEIKAAMEVLVKEQPTRMTAEIWLTVAAVLDGIGDQEGSAFAYQRAMECGGL
jgi:transcriptional regulator with XRE-family HTH domain